MTPETDSELHRRLAGYVARYCPRWMADQREDLAQIAWMRLEKSMKSNEANRSPGPTLIARVAYCTVIDEARRRRSRKEVSGVQERLEATARPEGGPERVARAREIDRGIRDCLGQMAASRGSSVTLHLLGHDAREIARLLAWPYKKARNAIFRGMSDLRLCLEKKGLAP